MAKHKPGLPNRRSIRLKNYDYAAEGLYFITLCCQDRAELFGSIKDDEMHLNEYGKIAYKEWKNTENIRDNIRLHEFIIMPNHIHGIIEILFKKEKKEISKGELKSSPSREKSESSFYKGELKFASCEEKLESSFCSEKLKFASCTGELQFTPTNAPTSPTAEFKSPSQTIGSIIRGYKIATIKKIKEKIKSNLEKINQEKSYSISGELKSSSSEGKSEIASCEEKLESSSYKGELQFASCTGELQFTPTTPTTKKIIQLDFKIWQKNYYEHIIRNNKAYDNISAYIIENPKKWGKDKFYSKKIVI